MSLLDESVSDQNTKMIHGSGSKRPAVKDDNCTEGTRSLEAEAGVVACHMMTQPSSLEIAFSILEVFLVVLEKIAT